MGTLSFGCPSCFGDTAENGEAFIPPSAGGNTLNLERNLSGFT